MIAHELLGANALDVLLRLELGLDILVPLEQPLQVQLSLLLLLLSTLQLRKRLGAIKMVQTELEHWVQGVIRTVWTRLRSARISAVCLVLNFSTTFESRI